METDTETIVHTNDRITIDLSRVQATLVAFLLDQEYGKWGTEHDHFMRHEDAYSEEILNLLDVIDIVREQMVDQGVQWDPELPDEYE